MEIIDRFEGDYAVVECDGAFQQVPRSRLPVTAKEGDVLRKTDAGYAVDEPETSRRRQQLAARRRRMLRGGRT